MNLSYINCPYSWFEDWNQICSVNRYRVAQVQMLPSGLPVSLLQKTPAALIVSSGDSVNVCYVMANIHRLDRGSVIDQQPLIMAFDHQNQIAYGAYLQHGAWPGRTYSVNTGGLIEVARKSGIQAYFPCVDVPKTLEGPVNELKVISPTNAEAFWNSVALLDHDSRKLREGI